MFRILRNIFKYGDAFFIRDPETKRWFHVDPANVSRIIVNESQGKTPEQYIVKNVNLVVGAAIGGILISGGVGKHLNTKHIFSERVDGKMLFKRGFFVEKNSNIVIVEDIITTGGSVKELIDLLLSYKVNIIGIICIVNRSEENIDFGFPFVSLLNLPSQSWSYENCPKCLKKIPITKPGSTGK